jgi:UDP-N-acetylmuramyl pentapeptide phosphotransferase/UDP-N-acetylglucosamine-1-phosphate transferase
MPTSILAGLLTTAMIAVTWPWLRNCALARPNPRSSHRELTPQGGGIVVVAVTLAVAWGGVVLLPAFTHSDSQQFLIVAAAAMFLGLVGAIDDIRALPALLRLVLQFFAVGTVIAALPRDVHIMPFLPWWMDRACLLLGGVWLVNLVNFMDGIDWISVAEVVPITATMVVLGLVGAIGALPALVAAALMGATLGFAPFNKPVARLFLGDVGSLPIGLLIGWLLLELAGNRHLAAAIILPLYYLADATITLARRVINGEPFWRAHRTHFYQRATDNGFTVPAIVAGVFVVNLLLAALALATVAAESALVSLLALAASTVVVACLLVSFARSPG